MAQGPPVGVPTITPGVSQTSGIYENPGKALEAIVCAYDAWSGSLTNTSLQMCYAVVAGDWLIFGSIDSIRKNHWAIWSLSMVLAALSVNMISAWFMSEWLRKTLENAECDNDWEKKFTDAAGKRDPFPFTKRIEFTTTALRFVKMICPLMGGLLLILGAWHLKPVAASPDHGNAVSSKPIVHDRGVSPPR
jgi:hypothetical protein